ncbi:MAG TPA: hypothetical protein VN028_07015, partial [Rhodocyclaceae bacterium]|nr:hypothetical protein [Rhodocyclaceae bacterium]
MLSSTVVAASPIPLHLATDAGPIRCTAMHCVGRVDCLPYRQQTQTRANSLFRFGSRTDNQADNQTDSR